MSSKSRVHRCIKLWDTVGYSDIRASTADHKAALFYEILWFSGPLRNGPCWRPSGWSSAPWAVRTCSRAARLPSKVSGAPCPPARGHPLVGYPGLTLTVLHYFPGASQSPPRVLLMPSTLKPGDKLALLNPASGNKTYPSPSLLPPSTKTLLTCTK